MIRVLIVDDHQIVREGLKQILSETTDIKVLAEGEKGYDALKQMETNQFDVVVLDISLPDENGLEILKKIKSRSTSTAVLILSIYSEEQYAIRALRAGAAGYLSKESASDELIEAIRKISRGRKYIPPRLAEKLAFELEFDTTRKPHEKLSDREFQVLCLLASGKTVTDISQELFLSDKTVSTYRTRILQKMNMKNNAQLIRYAIQHKLVG
jgi:DNA-binding NarL/FixJ family response regulator